MSIKHINITITLILRALLSFEARVFSFAARRVIYARGEAPPPPPPHTHTHTHLLWNCPPPPPLQWETISRPLALIFTWTCVVGGGVGPLNFEIFQSKNFLLKWKVNSINANKKCTENGAVINVGILYTLHEELEYYVDPLIFITQFWKVVLANIFAQCLCLLSCSGISGADRDSVQRRFGYARNLT